MKLLKTAFYTSLANVVKLISGLIINKVVSILIGPSGLAIIGQFQSFTQIVRTIAQGAINNGVTKYVAEYHPDRHALNQLIGTANRISLISGGSVAVILILFSKTIAFYVFENDAYAHIVLIFGITIILFVLNHLALSVINGLKEIRIWVRINIAQSIISLILTSILIYFYRVEGALIALVTNQSVVFFVLLYLLRDHAFLSWKKFTLNYYRVESRKLLQYAFMGLVGAILLPTSHLMIRKILILNLGTEYAGYWQAMWYFSSTYILLITSTLSVYYLPRLSELKENKSLTQEILAGYKIIIPILVFVQFGVFFSRERIIALLFSQEFAIIKDYFLLQLIADLLRIASLLLGYVLVAKAKTQVFIVKELVAIVFLVACTFIMVPNYGIQAVFYSYILMYSVNLLFLIFYYIHFYESKT